MAKRRVSRPWRYWGYVVLVGIVLLWFNPGASPLSLAVLSFIALVYFTLFVPIPCGAKNRGEGLCRNNASGVVKGCHLQSHKWKKFASSSGVGGVRKALSQTSAFWQGTLALCAEAATVVSGAAAVATLVIGN